MWYIEKTSKLHLASEDPEPWKANTRCSACVVGARQATSGIIEPPMPYFMGCCKDRNKIGRTKKKTHQKHFYKLY